MLCIFPTIQSYQRATLAEAMFMLRLLLRLRYIMYLHTKSVCHYHSSWSLRLLCFSDLVWFLPNSPLSTQQVSFKLACALYMVYLPHAYQHIPDDSIEEVIKVHYRTVQLLSHWQQHRSGMSLGLFPFSITNCSITILDNLWDHLHKRKMHEIRINLFSDGYFNVRQLYT